MRKVERRTRKPRRSDACSMSKQDGLGGGGTRRTPVPAALSCKVRSRLANQFQIPADLDTAEAILPQLRDELSKETCRPQELWERVAARVSKASADAPWLTDSMERLVLKLRGEVERPAAPPGLVRDVSEVMREVMRVERMRVYVDRALHVEQLVGVLEDAVSSTSAIFWDRRFVAASTVEQINQALGERLLEAVKSLQAVEDVLTSISKSKHNSTQLIWAVELRLDRAASSLRTAAIADFQSSMAAIGWPAPLTLGDRESQDNQQRVNSFVEAPIHSFTRFKNAFLVLSILQALQQQRTLRQDNAKSTKRKVVDIDSADRHPVYDSLWAMEELVSPFATQTEFHFRKWIQKPELVCALAYSICQEFVDIVDANLQPVIDRANLVGYSAREEWVLCLSAMARRFFKSNVFTGLAQDIQEGDVAPKAATSLWLHTIDQILAFDAKMKSLLVQDSGAIRFRSGVDAIIQHGIVDKARSGFGCMRLFGDRRDWLDLWAHIEFSDAWEKLRPLLDKEEAWIVKKSSRAAKSLSPSAGVPSGAVVVLASMWSLIDRCRTLPEAELRLAFVRGGAAIIAKEYHDELLDHAEGFMDTGAENEMLIVAACVNAARHCEYKLQEWSEDLFFLELRIADLCNQIEGAPDRNMGDETIEKLGVSILEGTIFDGEINHFIEFRKTWISNLVYVISDRFERNCISYSSQTKSWVNNDFDTVDEDPMMQSGQGEDAWRSSVSRTLVEALSVLQRQLQVLSEVLQEENFTEFCRDLATKLDGLLVGSILPIGAKLSRSGRHQLTADATALFQVFKPYFLRPVRFFKELADAIKTTHSHV